MKTLLFLISLFFVLCFYSSFSLAAKVAKMSPRINQDHTFNSQLVEGKIYRPDLSVVTGDLSIQGLGILKLRTHFVDHMAFDYEEKK